MHQQRLVRGHRFGDRAAHDQLGADQEANLLLHRTVAKHSAADRHIRKVELREVRPRVLDRPSLQRLHRAERRVAHAPRLLPVPAQRELGRVEDEAAEVRVLKVVL